MSGTPNDPHGQATFRGQVQDHEGRPIEGFVRVFRGDSPYVSRKITGAFLLQLPPGPYRIEVHADGYQPVQIKMNLHEQQGAAHQFIMNRIWHAGDAAGPPQAGSEPAFPDAMDLSDIAAETPVPEIPVPGSAENGKDGLSPEPSIEEMLYKDDDQ